MNATLPFHAYSIRTPFELGINFRDRVRQYFAATRDARHVRRIESVTFRPAERYAWECLPTVSCQAGLSCWCMMLLRECWYMSGKATEQGGPDEARLISVARFCSALYCGVV